MVRGSAEVAKFNEIAPMTQPTKEITANLQEGMRQYQASA